MLMRTHPVNWAEYDDCTWRFHPDCPLSAVSLGDKVVTARCNETSLGDRAHGLSIWILLLATSTSSDDHTEAIVLRKLRTHSTDFERIGKRSKASEQVLDILGDRQANELSLTWLLGATRSTVKTY